MSGSRRLTRLCSWALFFFPLRPGPPWTDRADGHMVPHSLERCAARVCAADGGCRSSSAELHRASDMCIATDASAPARGPILNWQHQEVKAAQASHLEHRGWTSSTDEVPPRDDLLQSNVPDSTLPFAGLAPARECYCASSRRGEKSPARAAATPSRALRLTTSPRG
jgi:hypothetical protein